VNIKQICITLMPVVALALPTWAHGPTPQQTEHRIEIATTPEAVWSILRNPVEIADWHPDISSATMMGDGQGGKRTIALASGRSLVDGIDRIDDAAMQIRWRLSQENPEAFPVSYYTNDVSVRPTPEGAAVVWKASFYRADTTNEPEDRFSDEAANNAMEHFTIRGLEGLKQQAEVLIVNEN
jgi:mxaD protein